MFFTLILNESGSVLHMDVWCPWAWVLLSTGCQHEEGPLVCTSPPRGVWGVDGKATKLWWVQEDIWSRWSTLCGRGNYTISIIHIKDVNFISKKCYLWYSLSDAFISLKIYLFLQLHKVLKKLNPDILLTLVSAYYITHPQIEYWGMALEW